LLEKIAEHGNLPGIIQTELSKGFFDNLSVSLKGKNHAPVLCTLSGFYLGLIADINGIAIIRVQPVDETSLLANLLEASRNELDEFVYRTTHDLRGPLATIRGLINLMKIENPCLTNDVKNLIALMEEQAETLDGRLSNLNYVSETAYVKAVDKNFDSAELESTLRSTLEQNMMINNPDFHLVAEQRFYPGVHAPLALAVLNHLLLYLIHLPKSDDARLTYTVQPEDNGMRVVISASGFISNYQTRQVVQQQSPLYTTVIMYSELINFFAAMKNAQRIKATICVDYIYEEQQQISVWIPGEAASYSPKAASY
jgi:light-regulated signal transduction histidine kinase (bacteriophytochrome)